VQIKIVKRIYDKFSLGEDTLGFDWLS